MAAASGFPETQNGSKTPVTLIIKTPNQKIKDLVIDCFLEWSVQDLKQQLSLHYPSHPVRKNESICCSVHEMINVYYYYY